MCGDDLLACICAYFIPPLGVYWDLGCGWEVCVCAILTLIGYFPGVIFAVVMIGCKEPASGRELPDAEKGDSADSGSAETGYVKVPE
mmetsp:Transcript_159113/g.386451  ORF Transcript_159113/g.386451 Transcript_159113/m.386451 type:complete len:87 (-) Transcript_159113:146-406(-)